MNKVSTNINIYTALKKSMDVPNAVTVAALEEYKEMKNNPSKYKRYASFDDALEDVL